jgi:peptidoglycan/xylan/chitin deacetylase (PgdA/CDA1 family)
MPEVTPQVLDLLDFYEIKATFFCVGENVQKYPHIYADLINRNHKTGNHTFNHLKGIKISTNEYVENTLKASEFIDSKLFRPPYGRITYQQKRMLKSKFQLIMWDLLTHDYDQKLSPEIILQNIQRYSRNGSIIVFHDSIKAKDNMLNVLPLAIDFWKNEGYSFGIL